MASARGVPPDSGVELDGTLVHGDPKVRVDWTNLVSEVVVRGGSLRYSTGLVGDGARRSWRVGGQRQLGRMRLDDPSIVAGWQDSSVSAPTPGVLWSSTRSGVAETLGGYRLWPVQAAAEDPADSGLIPDTSQTGQRIPPSYVSGGGLGAYVSGLFVTDYGIDNLDGDRDADPGLYLSLWETGQTGAVADPAGRSSSLAGPSFVAGSQLGLLLFAPGRGIIRIPLGELIADLSLTEPYRVPWDSLGLTVADWAAFWAAGEQTAVLVDRANPNIDWATAEHVPDATVTEVEATQLQVLLVNGTERNTGGGSSWSLDLPSQHVLQDASAPAVTGSDTVLAVLRGRWVARATSDRRPRVTEVIEREDITIAADGELVALETLEARGAPRQTLDVDLPWTPMVPTTLVVGSTCTLSLPVATAANVRDPVVAEPWLVVESDLTIRHPGGFPRRLRLQRGVLQTGRGE